MIDFEKVVVAEAALPDAAKALAARGMRLAVAFGDDARDAKDLGVSADRGPAAAGHAACGLVARYLFLPPARGEGILLEVDLDPAFPHLPSVAAVLPQADWYEREMRDLLGIVPIGHPDPRRLVLHEGWPQDLFPLRKDFDPARIPPLPSAPTSLVMPRIEGEGVFEVPVGPVHAGIIEPGHFRFSCLGDSILHLEPRLFYTHKGSERLAQGKTPGEAMPLAQSLCGVCVVSHAVAFAEAVEHAAGVVVPPRARFLRSFLLEAERLYNHVGDLANICAGFGFQPALMEGMHLKEQLLRANDALVGNRFLRWAVAVGGLERDIPDTAAASFAATAARIRGDLDRWSEKVLAHEGAIDRMEGTGILPRATAEILGCVGVAARASGVDIDARRDRPHAAYAEIPPRVVVRTEGDVLARFLVRLEEARESARLIQEIKQEILRSFQEGPVRVDVPPQPPGARAFSAVESPRGEEIHFVRFGEAGRIERFKFRSPSYVNWRAVPHTIPGNIVPDFPLINKSFELCYSCADM